MKNAKYLVILSVLFSMTALAGTRTVESKTLKNGMKVFFIQDTALPRVGFQALVKVGRLNEPASMYGVSDIVAEMLDQGTQKRKAEQLITDLADLGLSFYGSSGDDYTMYGMDSLSNLKEKSFQLFWEMMTSPRFDKSDFQRLKSSYIARLKKQSDDPGSFASDAFMEYLWVGHPFGVSQKKELKTVESLEVLQVQKFYDEFYYPQNLMVSVVGNIDKKYKVWVITQLEAWKKKNNKQDFVETSAPQKIEKTQIRLISKEKLAQTQIRIGQLGISRTNPDYIKLRIANEILGGGFSSRLMQKVRDDLGLTYSISSSISSTKDFGALLVTTFSKNETVGPALKETLKIYQNFANEGVTEKELMAAKAQLKGQFPRAIETADRLVANYLIFDFMGLDTSYFDNYNKLIDQVNLTDLNMTIRKYYQPHQLKVLIYGDQSKILSQLSEYKPEVLTLTTD